MSTYCSDETRTSVPFDVSVFVRFHRPSTPSDPNQCFDRLGTFCSLDDGNLFQPSSCGFQLLNLTSIPVFLTLLFSSYSLVRPSCLLSRYSSFELGTYPKDKDKDSKRSRFQTVLRWCRPVVPSSRPDLTCPLLVLTKINRLHSLRSCPIGSRVTQLTSLWILHPRFEQIGVLRSKSLYLYDYF